MHLFAPQKGEWGVSFTCIDRAIPGLGELEMVNGGSFIESLVRIGYSAHSTGSYCDCGLPLAYTLGSIVGLCKGVYDEIAGEGFAA